MATPHKYRVIENGKFLGARLLNSNSDRLVAQSGENIVIENAAYRVVRSYGWNFSNLFCFFYLLEPDYDLQDIIDSLD